MEQTTQVKKSGGSILPKLFIGCFLFLVISLCCICCITTAASVYAPAAVANALFSEESASVEVEKWKAEDVRSLEQNIKDELESEGETSISGDELTQLFIKGSENDDVKFQTTINSDDKAQLDLSFKSGEKFLNVSSVVDFEVRDGKFSTLTIDELKVGKFDLGRFLKGQDLAANINENLSTNENEELSKFLSYFEELYIEDGKFVLILSPEGQKEFLKD